NDFSLGGKLSSPPDGSYSISVNASDTAGNSNGDPMEVVLDDTAPTVSVSYVSGPSYLAYVSSSTVLKANASDAGSGLASCSATVKDGSSATVATPGCNTDFSIANSNPDGSYTVDVSATDNLGNGPATTSAGYTLDNTAPTYAETLGSPNYTSG